MRYLELFEEYIKNAKEKENQISKYRSAMKELSLNECVDKVIENCQEFINNQIIIHRIINIYEPHNINCFYSEPVERVSRDNANYYTLILDNSENWKDYPKRSHSFICTLPTINKKTIFHNSFNYQTYIVIPYDNSIFSVCNTLDIYFGFKQIINSTYKSIRDFFDGIDEISIFFGLDHIRDTSFNDMKDDINKLQEQIYKYKTYEDYINNSNLSSINNIGKLQKIDIFNNFLIKIWNNNIFDEIINNMDPDKNNFNLINYSSLVYDNTNHEIWVDSPCVFIPSELIDDFINELNKKANTNISI